MRRLRTVKNIAVALLFLSNLAFGWGKTGHQIINGNFVMYLPQSMQELSLRSSYYIQHASDADSRKSADPAESPKHFIDIDAYPEFAAGTLPHNLDSLKLSYGSTVVTKNGLLPWAIASTYDSLVAYWSRHDLRNADRIIADLGHYVGDAFQPLHCTQNYDGQLTGNSGIHSRFESGLLDRYKGSVSFFSTTVDRIGGTPVEAAFCFVESSNGRTETILSGDDYASGIDASHGAAYYSALWSALDTLMTEQLSGASESLASLVYSAWLDAGSPSLTTGLPAELPHLFAISEVYPNPFNPSASFEVNLPPDAGGRGSMISIYSAAGKLVRSERRMFKSGSNVVSFNLRDFPSGVYFVALELHGSGVHERHLMKAVLLK